MSDDERGGGSTGEQAERDRPEPERELMVYGRGVRTALRNNATAYGFSISITAAYGLANATKGAATAAETVAFALSAAVAFALAGLVFVAVFPRGSLRESGQVLTISGVMDMLAVAVAVTAALAIANVPGFMAWPLTGAGTVLVYLMFGGLDVVAARFLARHTSFGRGQ